MYFLSKRVSLINEGWPGSQESDHDTYSMQDLCKHGGWQLGHRVDGCHAEYFRMPYADTGLYHVPPNVDERGLLVVSDTLPTGLEVGAIKGNVHPGCTVAIVGAGELTSSFPLKNRELIR